VSPLAAVLAIDGGNSKTDVALIGSDGTILSAVRGGPSNHQGIGVEAASSELMTLVRKAAELAGLSADEAIATHTSACLAGADLPVEEAELNRLVQSFGWSASSSVVNDTFAVLRAGLADDRPLWGIGAVCGAGTNCAGTGPDGEEFRFLALGQISGDWGGGGDLGPEALWLAVRAEDGRGPQTELRQAVSAHFGVERVEDVTIGLHLGTIPHLELHGLVPVLFEVADRGDQVARELLQRQAEEICLMVEVAARHLGLARGPADLGSSGGESSDPAAVRPVPVVLGGSIMTARSPLLTSAITGRLTASIPGAGIRIVDVPPVVGAALLGLDHVGASASAAARLRGCARATW
jgi:N-acetylglucosamine kinase-like BadF-type ATPase